MTIFLALVFSLLVFAHGDAGPFRQGAVGVNLMAFIDNWIIILERFDGSVNFNRNWVDYRDGFGNKESGEFWLGNEKVHRLTNRGAYALRIEMYSDSAWYQADYASFSLDSEDKQYAIQVSGFSGNATDSLTNRAVESYYYHDGMRFSTPNFDNDEESYVNCAKKYNAGWWFNGCWISCLTCPYGPNFKWESLKNSANGKLGAVRMMIKRQCE